MNAYSAAAQNNSNGASVEMIKAEIDAPGRLA